MTSPLYLDHYLLEALNIGLFSIEKSFPFQTICENSFDRVAFGKHISGSIFSFKNNLLSTSSWNFVVSLLTLRISLNSLLDAHVDKSAGYTSFYATKDFFN